MDNQNGEFEAMDTLATIDQGHTEEPYPFSFFNLPPEIRNQIYDSALVSRKPLRIRDRTETIIRGRNWTKSIYWNNLSKNKLPNYDHVCTYNAEWVPSRIRPSTALLQLNRQIREEALSTFYEGNTFYFQSADSFNAFMSDQTLEARGIIRSVMVGLTNKTPASNIHETFPNDLVRIRGLQLKKLIVNVQVAEDEGYRFTYDEDLSTPHVYKHIEALDMMFGLNFGCDDWQATSENVEGIRRLEDSHWTSWADKLVRKTKEVSGEV